MAAASAAQSAHEPSFEFGSVEFFHRFTQGDHHEYTPAGQEDLQAWKQMVTIIRHPRITDSDGLAGLANAMLVGSQDRRGKLLRTDSVAATLDAPAEHLLVVVLGNPQLLEAVFARFVMRDGVGTLIMYAHREYGRAVGDQMSDWLRANGPAVEEMLMQWSAWPTLR